jgi:predicted dehydrogenase
MSQRFTFAILGAGGQGSMFSRWIREHSDCARVVAVADPDPVRRKRVADDHKLGNDAQYERWEELLAKPKLADVVVNTTMDRMHLPSSVKALSLGYHMILEKPMATSLADCIAIDRARREFKRIVAIDHCMRYTAIYQELKRLVDSGVIGELVSFDQLEAVEHLHQSHSFVRGNWGNESRSTFMLLAKSCHDVDILAHLTGKPCLRVSSFGSLKYFNKEHAPKGAPQFCTDGCPAEATCAYSSLKVYATQNGSWIPGHAGFTQTNFEERLEALRHSRFDRCVFQTDNDVVDHQVVAFEFEGGITGTFTMTAFTPFGGRFLRLHGTHGFIRAESDTGSIEIHRHADRKVDKIVIPTTVHNSADDCIMRNFIQALRQNEPNLVHTPTDESLRTHTIAFAAEKSRREKRTVEIAEMIER